MSHPPEHHGDLPAQARSLATLVSLAVLLFLLACAGQWLMRPGTHQPEPSTPIRGRIAINQAPPATLMLLPGVGPVTAERLVTHRREAGPLEKPEALEAIRGIGPVRRQRIAARVTFTRDHAGPAGVLLKTGRTRGATGESNQ